MSINQLISRGGTGIKSPVQRYLETKEQMGREEQNRLVMASNRQSMDIQRQKMRMAQEKQAMAKRDDERKFMAGTLRTILDQPEAERPALYENAKELWQKQGISPDKFAPDYDDPKAQQFTTTILGERKERFKTEMRDGVPVQVSSTSGLEKTSPRAAKKQSGLWSKIDPSKYTPASLNKFSKTMTYSDLEAKPKSLRDGLTVGESAVDRAFAKEYVGWSTGGFADVEKNLSQLKDAHRRLLSGKENLTGSVLGRTPDIVRQQTNPESIDVRDQVEEVVQRNLRLILGAQFTQKEGERLIARAYNEKLDEAVNAKRVGRLITAIETAAKAKQSTVDYYNENGTLKGYKGEQLSISDIDKMLDDGDSGEDNGWSIKKVNK